MSFDAGDHPPRSGGFWSTLFQRNFALLWFGGLASYIGDWAMLVALPLFVFEQTGSTAAAGALLTAKFAPMLLSSVAGVFVDRWDRRRILVRANLAMTVLTLPLLIPTTTAAAGAASLWIVYLSVIATSLAGLVVAPAENSLLPTLVGRDRLMVANSLNALNDNIARIAGPALGGLIGAYVGFAGVVVVNAACYAGAALLVALIRISPTSAPTRDGPSRRAKQAVSSVIAEWVDGLRVVRRSQLVAVVFVATALALLGDSVFSALLAPFVAQNFTDAAAVIGLVAAARGAGGLLAGLLTAPIARRVPPVHLMSATAIGNGVLFAAFVTVPRVPLALACVALLGGVLAVIWGASINTLLQTNVADHYLGRVFGAFSTTNATTMTLGAGAAAIAGQGLGTVNLLYVAAALYTLSGVVALVSRPRSPE